MKVKSVILEFDNNNDFSVEYIETQLAQKGIIPLRWAVVKIENKKLLVNVAYQTG